MSSTERAPEPTMEDILASIRRIITDDDTGKASPGRAAAQSEDEGLEGEADNQIIDDIARVLTSGGDAPANQDEEIMDLTGELGGLELVEDEPEELIEAVDVIDTAPEFVEASDESEDLLALDDIHADVLEPDVLEAEMLEAAVLEPDALEPDIEVFESIELVETVEVAEFAEPEEMELPAEEVSVPQMPPMASPPPIPQPVAEAAPEAPKLSASEEAATALERAIAALKAGQSPSTAPAPMPAAAPVPSFGAYTPAAPSAVPEAEEVPTGVIPLPADIPMAVPMDSPTPDAETHLDPDVESVLEMAEGATEHGFAEDEFVLADTESEVTMVLDEVEPEQEAESAPFWPPQSAETVEPELAAVPVFAPSVAEVARETVAVATNGAASHGTPGGKSLEDSIKEMLRPMLREWLNENMPRMIREELDSDAVQRGQD